MSTLKLLTIICCSAQNILLKRLGKKNLDNQNLTVQLIKIVILIPQFSYFYLNQIL